MKQTGAEFPRFKLLLGATALVVAGCSGGKVDIGDEGDASTGGGNSKLAAFEGSWDGEIDLWEAESGSNRVRIELDADGQGTVRFGDRPIESAADHPYPNDASVPDHDSPSDNPVESAFYPVRGATLDEGRLEFFVELGDLFDGFCTAQAEITPSCDPPTPFGTSSSSDACSFKAPDGDDVWSEVEVPCYRVTFCYHWRACECSEDTCEARDFHEIEFRMERLEGQMTGEVHLGGSVYQEIDFD